MSRTAQDSYRQLVDELKETAVLASTGSLLAWDERTQLPPKGAEFRAQQMALIAKLVHERFTAPHIGDLLAEVAQSQLARDALSDPAVNVREWRRAYDREQRLPVSWVQEMARTEVLAQQAWADARSRSDYGAFEPWLGKVIELKRQQARCYMSGGDHQCPYDSLLDEYEPGQTAADLEVVFDALRGPLVELIGQITSCGREAPIEILQRHYPAAIQQTVAREAAASIGFDFEAGRLDVSLHPFCSGIGPGDVRLTTRYDENYFGDAFFGVLHEAGHGLYEQGLPADHYGSPRGEAVSLGIHESQSRLWENLVGRGRAFWVWFMPRLRSAFPEATRQVSEDEFFRAVNDVRPSLIRTESDETTYNLHVLLRFELERALLDGDLSTAALPDAWNQRMKRYLGIDVPDHAHGCLQDIHWSGGAIGYFPTYMLGNLYAAQFYQKAKADVSGLESSFARGDFAPLLQWLRTNIHSLGKRYRPRELVQHVTGSDLAAAPLLKHLRDRAAEVYGI